MGFSIRVVDGSGRPLQGVSVYVNFGVWHGHMEEYTGSDGWAEFEPAGDHASGEIFVKGENYGSYDTSDGATHSFTVDD